MTGHFDISDIEFSSSKHFQTLAFSPELPSFFPELPRTSQFFPKFHRKLTHLPRFVGATGRNLTGQALSGATCATLVSGSALAAQWQSPAVAVLLGATVGYAFSLLTLLINVLFESLGLTWAERGAADHGDEF